MQEGSRRRQVESKPRGELNEGGLGNILASGPSYSGFNSEHSQIFIRGKIVDVAKAIQWCWLEESGQWLENVD